MQLGISFLLFDKTVGFNFRNVLSELPNMW